MDSSRPADNDSELYKVSLLEAYSVSRSVELRDEIFSCYQGVVGAIVRRYAGRGERDDLLQVGFIGLLGAIDKFDPARGVKFSTYATHRVEGELRHFLRDKSESIRRPRWMKSLSRQVAAFLEKFLQEQERLPSLREISEALNIEESGVRAILMSRKSTSLDDEKSLFVAQEKIRNSKMLSFKLPVEDRIVISQAFEKLLDLEKKVVYLFFVKDFSQKEIAGRLALSPRKVSRLMQKALGRLRAQLNGGKS